MAIVRELKEQPISDIGTHSETTATFTVVTTDEGEKYLQIDTYGSSTRKIRGKKSQSIRFSPAAVEQLRDILRSRFPRAACP